MATCPPQRTNPNSYMVYLSIYVVNIAIDAVIDSAIEKDISPEESISGHGMDNIE